MFIIYTFFNAEHLQSFREQKSANKEVKLYNTEPTVLFEVSNDHVEY